MRNKTFGGLVIILAGMVTVHDVAIGLALFTIGLYMYRQSQ